MDAETRQHIQRLERELSDLRNRFARLSGHGVSHREGAVAVRPTQVGFAAELTGTYNSTTGYPWKKLTLDLTSPPGLENGTIQPTGNRAFEVNDDETLTSGTRVWLEPQPDGPGYVFDAEAAGARAVVLTEATGLYSWQGRQTNSGGTDWEDTSGATGTNDSLAVEMDGDPMAPKPTANGFLFPDARTGRMVFVPVQAADKVGSTYYPGYVSTGAQVWEGAKKFVQLVQGYDGFIAGGTGSSWDYGVEVFPSDTAAGVTFGGAGSLVWDTSPPAGFEFIGGTGLTVDIQASGSGAWKCEGQTGITGSRSFTDAGGSFHAVTLTGGLVTDWAVTPP